MEGGDGSRKLAHASLGEFGAWKGDEKKKVEEAVEKEKKKVEEVVEGG